MFGFSQNGVERREVGGRRVGHVYLMNELPLMHGRCGLFGQVRLDGGVGEIKQGNFQGWYLSLLS